MKLPERPLTAKGEPVNTKSMGALYMPSAPVKPLLRSQAEQEALDARRADFQRRLDAGLIPTRIVTS